MFTLCLQTFVLRLWLRNIFTRDCARETCRCLAVKSIFTSASFSCSPRYKGRKWNFLVSQTECSMSSAALIPHLLRITKSLLPAAQLILGCSFRQVGLITPLCGCWSVCICVSVFTSPHPLPRLPSLISMFKFMVAVHRRTAGQIERRPWLHWRVWRRDHRGGLLWKWVLLDLSVN